MIDAARRGRTGVTETLLILDVATPMGEREALRCAALSDRVATVELLGRHGVEPDRTSFYVAVSEGDLAMVRTLLAHGADADSTTPVPFADTPGRTKMLDVAAQEGHVDVAKLLLDAGATFGPKSLHEAVKAGQLEMVKFLVNQGADVNSRVAVGMLREGWVFTWGGTILMMAARYGREEVARYLLSKGADIRAQDSMKKTALMWGLTSGDVGTVKLLLESGADPNYVFDGKTLRERVLLESSDPQIRALFQ